MKRQNSIRQLTNRECATLLEELYYLLHGGIGLAAACAMLQEEAVDPAIASALGGMAEDLDHGASMTDAIRHAGCFPAHVEAMLAIAEQAGRTEETLLALAHGAEASASLEERLHGAVLQPALLFVVMLAVIGVLLVYVLPIFNDVYAQLGGSLTGLAALLLQAGTALQQASPFLVGLCLVLAIAIAAIVFSPRLRSRVTAWVAAGHGSRSLMDKIDTGRFATALSMCMSSGLYMEDALQMCARLSRENSALATRCSQAAARLQQGEALTQVLSGCHLLPLRECRMLEASIRGGAGEQAMEEIARRLTEAAGQALENTVARVEPAMITVSALLVGVMLLSVMLPLVNIMSAIG